MNIHLDLSGLKTLFASSSAEHLLGAAISFWLQPSFYWCGG